MKSVPSISEVHGYIGPVGKPMCERSHGRSGTDRTSNRSNQLKMVMPSSMKAGENIIWSIESVGCTPPFMEVEGGSTNATLC